MLSYLFEGEHGKHGRARGLRERTNSGGRCSPKYKKNKWAWAEHWVWGNQVTEWLQRGGATSRETSSTHWRDDLREFWGKKWIRADGRWVGVFFVLLVNMARDDDSSVAMPRGNLGMCSVVCAVGLAHFPGAKIFTPQTLRMHQSFPWCRYASLIVYNATCSHVHRW